jgi:putative ABC transport system permease protein
VGPALPEPGVQFLTARDWVQREIDEEGELIDFFLAVLIGLAVGYTGLAVANTLLMATAARRTEFRTLRLAGTDTGRMARIVSLEALLSVAAGTLLGAAVAATALTGMARAVAAELGRPVDLVVPWGSSALVVTACAVVAVAAAVAPVLSRR